MSATVCTAPTNRLVGLAAIDGEVFGDLDPEPVQPFALDFTWAAVLGLAANLDAFAQAVDGVAADGWSHRGVLAGRAVTALDLANGGAHEVVHHLVEAERLVKSRPANRAIVATAAPRL